MVDWAQNANLLTKFPKRSRGSLALLSPALLSVDLRRAVVTSSSGLIPLCFLKDSEALLRTGLFFCQACWHLKLASSPPFLDLFLASGKVDSMYYLCSRVRSDIGRIYHYLQANCTLVGCFFFLACFFFQRKTNKSSQPSEMDICHHCYLDNWLVLSDSHSKCAENTALVFGII